MNRPNKKIVLCSCSESGYDIADFLLNNNIKISYFVSIRPELASKLKISGYKSFELLSKKYNVPIYYPKIFSMKNKTDMNFFNREKLGSAINDTLNLFLEFADSRQIPS